MKRTVLLLVILAFSSICSAQRPSESNLVKDGGNLAIFRTMALLGDSLGSGEISGGREGLIPCSCYLTSSSKTIATFPHLPPAISL